MNQGIKEMPLEKKGYKKTKFGWIPKDWNFVEFGNYVERIKTKHNPKLGKQVRRCIELEHLEQETGRILGFVNSDEQKSIKNVFLEGQVLFGKLRPYLKKYWLADFDGVCSSEIWVLNSKDKKILNDFIFYLIQQHDFIQASNVTSGSKMPRADWNYVSQYPFLFPPTNEQESISKCISLWDRSIQLLDGLINSKKLQKRALSQKLLNPVFKGANSPNKWELKTLSSYVQFCPRRVIKPSLPFTKLGIRSHCKGTFLNKNFEPQKIAINELYLVKKDDLIVNITFAWEGAIAIVQKRDEKALVSHRFPTYILKEGKADVDFFRHFIKQGRFRYMLQGISPGGAGRNRVMSKKDFLKLKVRIPEFEEQKAIAEVLQCADYEIQQLKVKLDYLKEQKKGLMQQLLTGKKRLPIV